jgi:hypothetical protein
MGGDMQVKSQVGLGTTFTFDIQVEEGQSGQAQDASSPDRTAAVKASKAKAGLEELKSGLNNLPPELLARLRDGLVLGDLLMIETAIADIEPYNPLLRVRPVN